MKTKLLITNLFLLPVLAAFGQVRPDQTTPLYYSDLSLSNEVYTISSGSIRRIIFTSLDSLLASGTISEITNVSDTSGISGAQFGDIAINSTHDTLLFHSTYGWIVFTGAGSGSAINLYNNSGTITANRVVTGGSFDLNMRSLDDFQTRSNTLHQTGKPSALSGTYGTVMDNNAVLLIGHSQTASDSTMNGAFTAGSYLNFTGSNILLTNDEDASNNSQILLDKDGAVSYTLGDKGYTVRLGDVTSASTPEDDQFRIYNASLDLFQIDLSSSQVSFYDKYTFPNATPTSDGNPYALTWTSGTGAFTDLSAFSSYWTLSGSDLYNNSGTEIGINVSSPAYTLDVGTGGIRVAGQSAAPTGAAGVLYYDSDDSGLYLHDGADFDLVLTDDDRYWTLSGSDLYNNSGTQVGINFSTPAYPLDVGSASQSGIILNVGNNGNVNQYIQFGNSTFRAAVGYDSGAGAFLASGSTKDLAFRVNGYSSGVFPLVLKADGTIVFDTDSGSDPLMITRLGNPTGDEDLTIYVADQTAMIIYDDDEATGETSIVINNTSLTSGDQSLKYQINEVDKVHFGETYNAFVNDIFIGSISSPTATLDVSGDARFRSLPDSAAINSVHTDVSGYVYESPISYAEMYILDTDPDTITLTAGTPDTIAETTAGKLLNYSHATGRLTYDGTINRTVRVVGSATVSASLAANAHLLIYKNGTIVTGSKQSTEVDAADELEAISISCLVDITPGDYIQVYTDISTNGDVRVHNLNLSITDAW